MVGQQGFFDLSDRYAAPSAEGDPLERLAAVVDFEVFCGPLMAALRRSDRGKSGRPPFYPVMMFKILVLQALYSLSDEAAEFQIKGWLSFQRFLGLELDGRVPELISKQNTGSGVWADTTYRSKKNEAFLERGMFKSNIHQRRIPRQPLPNHIARANARRSAVRSAVEHVFAGQKHRMGLFIRTIGIARARIKIGMANIA